jgi:hypothetical protein
MVQRFNCHQILLGTLNVVIGFWIVVLAWFFFRYVTEIAFRAFWPGEPIPPTTVAYVICGLLLFTGIWQWRRGEGYQVFADTPFYAAIGETESGAMTQLYVHRVTGLACALSQIFLAGPRQLCTGITRFRFLLSTDPELERRMSELLASMRAIAQWEPATKYANQAVELGALIRCGFVEYSPTKMKVKAAPGKNA